MLILSSEAIEKAAPPHLWTDVMELALKASTDKDYFTPDRMHVEMDGNTLLVMPSVGPDMFTTKLVSVFPGNAELGEPVIHGTVLLNEGRTGEAVALLNGAKLTAMRTAAVASVGVRHLTDPLIHSLGVIGAGAQGRHIAWLAAHERDIERIYVYDRSIKMVQEFLNFMTERLPNVEVAVCEDEQQLVKNSEVIITATTSEIPVLPNLEDLLLGKTIISVGSYKPNMRELPESLFRLIDQVWIDADHGRKESGDLIFPLENKLIEADQIRHIVDLIESPQEISFRETRLFKTVGQGLFDLFAAKLVYERARMDGIGYSVKV